MDKAERF